MRRSFVLCLLFLLSAVAAAGPRKPAPKSEPVVDPRIAAAKQLVTDSLKDPESARFREIFVARDGETVCGAVNAKNSMGGYVGFRRFMIESGGSMFFDDSGPSFPGLIDMTCKK